MCIIKVELTKIISSKKKIEEIRTFEEKIAHLANQNIEIDLDDGVNVNYQKFIDVLAKKD